MHVDELSCSEFIERFEEPVRPVVISGLLREWRANEQWLLDGLLRDYGGERFKVGEDDDGYAVYVKLKYFLRYMLENDDDSPLYIFDSSFAVRANMQLDLGKLMAVDLQGSSVVDTRNLGGGLDSSGLMLPHARAVVAAGAS